MQSDERYGPVFWSYGTDEKIGELSDRPNSGELLYAAMAACEDNTLRMIANHLGVTLRRLGVEVTGDVDSRGCMAMDHDVPVGFLGMNVAIELEAAAGTPARLVELVLKEGERLCVNLDTLRRGAPITVKTGAITGPLT